MKTPSSNAFRFEWHHFLLQSMRSREPLLKAHRPQCSPYDHDPEISFRYHIIIYLSTHFEQIKGMCRQINCSQEKFLRVFFWNRSEKLKVSFSNSRVETRFLERSVFPKKPLQLKPSLQYARQYQQDYKMMADFSFYVMMQCSSQMVSPIGKSTSNHM